MRETRLPDYMDKLKEMYPDIDEKSIKKIIVEGCKNITTNARNNDPVLVEHPKKGIKFLVHTYS